MFEHQSERSGL